MRRRNWTIALVVLGAAGLAGGAYAATQDSGNPQQAIINDAAARLHVTPAQLTSALKQALIDRIEAAVKAGQLTQAQADAIKQRIEQSNGLPLPFGPFFGGPGMHGLEMRPHLFLLHGVASYLGLSDSQLLQQLRSGKTLKQIATAHGKSAAGLENAILSGLRTRLDAAVAEGRITRSQERELLSRLRAHLDEVVNIGLPGPPPGGPGWDGPPGGPLPGGPGWAPPPGGPPPGGPGWAPPPGGSGWAPPPGGPPPA